MSKLIRSPKGRLALLTLLFCGIAISVVFQLKAQAAMYVNPFWTSTSPSPESPVAMVAGRAFVCESGNATAVGSKLSVDVRTGELFYDLFLFDTPGVLRDTVFSLRWRSMIAGASQLGNGVLPSWEPTVQYVLLNGGAPNAPNGHRVDVRRANGRIDPFMWTGSAYAAPAGVKETLAVNGSGNYFITDKWGGTETFDTRGMPAQKQDPKGNTITLTYNAQYQITGYVDDRGKSYTFTRNGLGFLTSITDPAGRTWYFGYDVFDNLTTITTPSTPDQTSGITVTLGYDGYNRMTSVTDGRGNTVWAVSYSGTTGKVSTITIGGGAVSYSYPGSTQTDRTDRNGNVHRYYYSGGQISKTCIYDAVLMAEKYATQHYYTGAYPAYTVFPRGNRIDWTFDSNANMTSRRRRTQNTSTNDSSDILHQWGYNTANFCMSYTDPLGNQWTYGRDSLGSLTSVTHPNVSNPSSQTASVSFTYNGKGQVTRRTSEEGKFTDYTYYGSGANSDLLYQIKEDAAGLALTRTYTYDSAWNVATETDPRGNATSCTWDNLRRLTQAQAPSPLSYRIQRHYDGNGNLTSTDVENIDKDGNVVSGNQWITTSRTYTNMDDLATLVEEIDASTTRTTSLQYDGNQNLIWITKPEGNKEKWTYNNRDLVASHITGEGATGESTEDYTYDDNGNRAVVEDGRDHDTTSTFDLFDRETMVTDQLGHYTVYELDKNGRTTKVTRKNSSDAELQRETYYYDERGRHWKTSALFNDPSQTYADAVTIIARLKTGQVTAVTDPRSHDTTYTYDGALRLIKVTDAMGNEWSYTLDGNGNRTAWSIKEKDGTTNIIHSYEATYDQINRQLTRVEIDRINPSNRLTTQCFHDSRSNLTFQINAMGNPTRWTFDGLNRMTRAERALTVGSSINDFTSAQSTWWGFDKDDRLTSHKDDGNHETTWAYDALDRPTTMTYPDTKTVQYQYDLCGNVTQTTDAAGNVVADTFDNANRNTSRSVTLATGFLGTTSETRTFDGAGRMVTNEDNDYNLEFEYAVNGLDSFVYKETQSHVGQTANAKSVTSTYDAAGNRVSEAYPSGASLSLTYAYNEIDRLSSISDGTSTIASYSWIGTRKKTETFQSGARRTNWYTGFREEIESVRHETSGSSTILRLDYGYNAVHDRTYERFGASGSAGDAFEYDKLRRLTGAWMGSSTPISPSGNPYVKKIEYNYDDDGNRTSVVVTPYQQSPQTTNYSTNNLSEYTSVGGASQSSDANGNLVDNGTYLFLYDYKNHIVQVKDKSSGSVLASYRYDALGRRVEKNVGGAVQRHILSWSRFSDAGLLLSTAAKTNLSEAERIQDLSHVVAVYDDSNNWLQNFVWSDEIDGIQMLEQKDVLDYDTDGNTTEITRSFYHRNALGSVMEITDMNQAEVVSYRYDPYGKVTITVGGTPQSSDPLGNHWTFAGMFLDEESALLYCRARHCDPCTGRFAQRDPLGVAAGPSLFVYVDNRPPNERDPSGLQGSHCRLSEYFTEGADKFMEKLDEEIAAGRKDSGNLNDLVGFGVGTFASYAGCVISERLFGYNDYPRGFGPYAAADTPFGLQLGLQYYDHDFSFLGGHHFEFTAHVGIAIAGLWTMDDLRTLDNSNGDIAIAAGFAIKF